MKEKSIKLIFPISVMLALALTFGSSSYAFAEPPAHAEKVDVLVSFTEKPGPAEQALIRNADGKVKRNYHHVPTIAASIPKGKLDSLRRNPKVTSVEEDVIVQIIKETLPWEVDRIGRAEIVHSENKGRGVKVAILDTGIDLDHPDLAVAGNVTFVTETTSGDDDHGHGTMVAGIISALDNDIGVTGVAPETELYSVKVLNKEGRGYCSDILSGIEWAIDNGMNVVNMSFASRLNLPSAVETVLEKAYQAGIVLVAGSGNAGYIGWVLPPARYESVIAVGATDQQDARASFSCAGPMLELMAPGVSIMSTSLGGGCSSGSGTSFSAPYVTGVAALLIASGVTHNTEVRQILQGTAEDLGSPGWDSYYGWGLVNAALTVPNEEDPPVSETDEIDKTPPSVSITASPNLLWPPDHTMIDVTIDGLADDGPDGSGLKSAQIKVEDEYGEVELTVAGFSTTVQLEAWRDAHDHDGRVYTISITATDYAGNMSTAETTVTVPHDQAEKEAEESKKDRKGGK